MHVAGHPSAYIAQLIKALTFIEHKSAVTVFIKSATEPSPESAKSNRHLQFVLFYFDLF
jgi:hypothetical protein